MSLISPLNGSVVSSGSNITVAVHPFANANVISVDFFVTGNNPALKQSFVWDSLTNAPFTDVISAPTNYFGPLTITAIAVDNQGNYDSEQCMIEVLPGTNLTLKGISVLPNSTGRNLFFTELGVSQSLRVQGTYSDGVARDITLAGAGTVYSTSETNVALVDINGNVSATGNGSAEITVSNAGFSCQIPVEVNLQPPQIISLLPSSLQAGSSNVTISLAGMNLGGTTNIALLRNGQPVSHIIVGPFVMGANAANVQVPLSLATNTPVETLTVVVSTPVGNSGFTVQQGNQFAIIPSPVVSFTNLHGFLPPFYNSGLGVSTNIDGFSPRAGLVLSGNTLYGTASDGGSAGSGAVFRVNTDGTGFTNLHSFTAVLGSYPDITNTDGAYPVASLVLSGNTLYGTAESGGSSGNGTVFRINTDGTGFTNLHNFTPLSGSVSSNSDGAWLQAGLVLSGNTLYGTAEYGGSSGAGTVFALNTDGSGFTALHSFTGGDGAFPVAGLILAGNTLYGATYEGGDSGDGAVFSINTDGSAFTNLYSFTDGNDGAGPQGGVALSGNTLYGTASQGGSWGNGTVFAVGTNGAGFSTLYSFAGYPDDGAVPVGGLILSGTNLYGTAESGSISDYGTVFAINTDGSGYITLHGFSGNPGDGAYPEGGLILSANTLYGTAKSGGRSGNGTVFSLSLVAASCPQLNTTASGPNVIITWPANAIGFTLQSTTNLVSPGSWSAVFPRPVVVNGQNTVTDTISGSQQFYRLTQ
jgi:uncharacterized repeat protein (TIGR03803 family)